MMRRSRHHRRKEPAELQITAFMNLMVVLVPFLLITAVFSQMAVLDLNLPDPSAETPQDQPPPQALTVVIRAGGLSVSDSSGPVDRFPPLDTGEQDYAALSELLVKIKDRLPKEEKISLLLEPGIEYEVLIQAMDAVRLRPGTKTEMFPLISIGDAPTEAGA